MARLRLNLLGAPELWLDDRPVSLDRQKALALLAYLAISGQAHGREHLAALLWPDLTAQRAQAALRQAIWAIGAALGPDWIASDRVRVQLVAEQHDLDVAEFRSAVQHSRGASVDFDTLAAAVERYRGDLLAGLELRDAAPFDEWRFFESEALRADLSWALDTLADTLTEHNEHQQALEFARRRLALDPLHEPAQRRLIRLYAAAGQRSAALRQYDECVRILQTELGVEPDAETIRLYQEIRTERPATHAQAVAPPTVASLPPRMRLPRPTTPFIGREPELAAIAELLADPACRLINLLGPGGIGKTRLAIAAAERAAPQFADGAVFVALADVADPAGMPSAIAGALGLGSPRAEGLAALIADYLRERQMLLVIDNLEHLISGADQLSDLLEQAPDIRMIVTSRERIGLPGEWSLDIAGLPVALEQPDPAHSAALSLFVQAARRARPNYNLSPDDLPVAVRICLLVGGAPLAIELAAAWLRLMPITQIAAALSADLDFLTAGARGLPERHRGLRAVFDHSWRLLTPGEQHTFAALTIFQGGFTLAAAEALCAGFGPAAPHILALVDKSLVRRIDEQRYDLHALLRQYAAEYLQADPTTHERVRRTHGRYYLDLLRSIEPKLKGENQRAAIDLLAGEINNLRAAWRSAISRVDLPALAAGLESLFIFYETRSLFEEGEEMFGRAATALAGIERPDSAHEAVLLGNLLARQGWFALRLYRFAAAQALMQWALELLRNHLDRPDALAGSVIANFQGVTGGRINAPELLREQLDRLRRVGDTWNLAQALYWSGIAAELADEAVTFITQSLEVSRAHGNQRLAAQALDSLADICRNTGDLARSRELYREALEIDHSLGARWAAAYTLDKMGYLARILGDYATAAAEHQQSLSLSQELGDRLGVAGSLDNLALLALDQGDLAEAERMAREGLELRQIVGHAGSTSVSLETLGLVALAHNDTATALRLLEECADLRRKGNDDWLLARVLDYTGRVYLACADLGMARLYLQQALATADRSAAPVEFPPILADIARLLLAEGKQAAAAELAQAVITEASYIVAVRQVAEAVLARSGPPDEPPRSLKMIIESLLSA